MKHFDGMSKFRLLSLLALLLTAVTGTAWAQGSATTTYKVKMKAGTKDADKWTIASGTKSAKGDASLDGVTKDAAVTLKYNGRLKVKSVKATTDAKPVNATIEITTSDINEGDPSVVFIVKLSAPPQDNATVQVKVGETTYDVPVDATGAATLTLDNANGDDAYFDASSVTAKVVGVTGGNYANIVTGQTATANIADTIDETTVSITTSNFTESDPSIDFNVQLSNPPQGSATVQVKVGEEAYDVPVDATGTGTLTLEKSDIGGASSVTAKVVGVTGGNFEKVVTGQTATAQKN